MGLKDTVSGMLSEDYKERFKAEYQQIKIRTKKLKALLCKWLNGDLNFDLSTPVEILMAQLDVMEQYMTLLEARAAIEGIEL